MRYPLRLAARGLSVLVSRATAGELPERIRFLLDAGFQLFDLVEPSDYDDCFAQRDAIFIARTSIGAILRTMTDGFVYEKWTAFIPRAVRGSARCARVGTLASASDMADIGRHAALG
jgi:hypothetical protein